MDRPFFGREAVKRNFSTAKTPATVYCMFVLFKDTLEEKWWRRNWWVRSLCLSMGKNEYFTEDAHWIRNRSQVQASSQVKRRAKKNDKLYFLHSTDSPGRLRLKRSLKATCQSQEKYTARPSGNMIRTQSIGSTWPGHRKTDCSLGKQGLTPSSFMIQLDCIERGWCPRTVRRRHTNDSERQGKLQE